MTNTQSLVKWFRLALVAFDAVLICYGVKWLLEAFQTFDAVTKYTP